MKKLKISKQTKKELSKQQQSKIKGGVVAPNCSCTCPYEGYGNTSSAMAGLGE